MLKEKKSKVNTEEISKSKIAEIYNLPFPELIFRAQTVMREHHSPDEVQLSTLCSIKTGGCSEDCSYCPQSARYNTEVDVHPLLDEDFIIEQAKSAKECGSTRFCMGASWRDAPNDGQFDQIISITKKVREIGMEPCMTLGMLHGDQAKRLKEAGLHSYNHNLDTSPEFYGDVITTRTYQERLDTIAQVQDAGLNVCSGGIVGLGESEEDRVSFLHQLANLNPQPKSVPVNVLVPVKGTPQYERLEKEGKLDEPIDKFAFIRTVATARIIMPKAAVRLSAGRLEMSDELQALAFLAGANSIFAGEKLLTTPNPGESRDHDLISTLGMKVRTKVEA